MTSEVATALKPNVSSSGQKSRVARQEWEFLNPLSDRRWDELARSHADCSIFHSAGWAKVLCKTYRHKPFYLRLSQGEDTVALIPLMEVASLFTGRRGVCLPFSDFCAPLFFDESVQSSVISKLSQLAVTRNWKFIEIRSTIRPSASAAPSAIFYSHKIDLSYRADDLFARLKSPVRRAIRKALGKGVTAEITRSRKSMLMFYELHVRTRRRHGLPPQSKKFFVNIHEELINNGLGFVVLAHNASQPVAAAVFLRCGKNAIYKYGASDERYQELRGNDLVMWQSIDFLVQEGAKTLHLGRTAIENDGLRRFKTGWNVTEEMLHYFRFDVSRNSWLNVSGLPRTSTSHQRVFSRLPLKVNQLAGRIIYPHLD